jgi:hypothetical protein
MEAIVVKRDQLLRNYLYNAIERVHADDDVTTDELVEAIEDAANVARDLAAKGPVAAVAAFRGLLQSGHTATLLPDSVFTRMEQLYHSNKDYAIIITDAQGEYLGAIPGRDATW